ncbi:hypothetical protein GCM10008910_27570 [Faecalicatena orotica]|jgi:hypothetical protein|uniref:Uncharacterized protein n=1 Tax=Faecalicatena orotica TaxID=1544 RepID=A0A2Y9BEW2_9FIRM|nr:MULTISPECIES: hypothetical protein [Clostridia]PWJ28869.1 hypothetical protein A8806_10717 [Faecalicatena orotica]SSA56038.1 hypothetical protein SAMN05216536_10717 [Faecalicatena orotica]
MKEFIEEYGGIMMACFMGLLFLGVMSGLLDPDGGLSRLAVIFAEGIGTLCS